MAHIFMRLVVLFLIPLGGYAQTGKVFNIGDAMPSLTFRNVFNPAGPQLSTQDYKGKLVIIDFWNRWCGSCIEAFPKMEKLQKEFGDKIKILLVTTDKKEEVGKLFKRFKIPELTILYGDTILNSMFPHIAVPHHVWINPNGRIQFITDGYNATTQNISKVLEGKKFMLPLKKELEDIDSDADLWKEGNGRFQKYITNYSFIMSRVKDNWEHGFGFSKDTASNTCGFKFVNSGLLDLYKVAFCEAVDYSTKDFYYNNRVQFIGAGVRTFFDYPDKSDSIPAWEERNLICYESKWQTQNDSLAYQYLQDDANRYFPFSVKVENKEVPCYILKLAPGFTGSKPATNKKLFEYTDSTFILKNMPIGNIVESLNNIELFKATPVVDETNYTAGVDIQLKNAFTDITNLQKQLLLNSILLEQGTRKIRMLVISLK
ncbi:MAG: redoxin domain-containing protein [Bacteroidetes bacterium]|nr:redoxin domain-containing protein [Bacteroidota bacterium]